MFMPNYIWAFLIALFVALIATPAVIVLAAKTGAMDAPDARKVHKGPMPRIGGLAIYCGFMAKNLGWVKIVAQEAQSRTSQGCRKQGHNHNILL